MREALRVAICEDNAQDAQSLLAMLAPSGSGEEKAHCECFENGEDFLAAFFSGKYDLVFLDIYMAGMKGVDVAKVIRESDSGVVLAFTTTSLDHTLDSYRLGALGYLEKPVRREEVKKMLALAEMHRQAEKSISLPIGGAPTSVALRNILFFEAKNHGVIVHTTSGILQTTQTVRLDDLEKQLPETDFLRCHRGFIVHLLHVRRVDRDFIMKNGERAYIRSNEVKRCTDIYKNYQLDRLWRDEE